MTADEGEVSFSLGLIDDSALFSELFSSAALSEVFESRFSNSTGTGSDRRNGFQLFKRANTEFSIAATKCLSGRYWFLSVAS